MKTGRKTGETDRSARTGCGRILATLALAGAMLGGVFGQPNLAPKITVSPAVPRDAAAVRVDGEYTDRESLATYIVTFGRLPRNFITKDQARRLGWQGGPLERYAPGKSIGGDRFGNFERRLPQGRYRECDVDTRGRPRGAKRLIYTDDRGPRRVYYTADHYRTFRKIR